MKHIILIFAVLSSLLGFSQEKAVRKGNLIIDAYIGGPQIISRLNGSNTADGIDYAFTAKGTGPFGGRIEYMLTPKSSLGLEFNHATSNLRITWNDNYDILVQEVQINRTRFFPRYALHFGGRKLDAFWHIGAGVSIWSIDVKTLDPSSTINSRANLNRGVGPVLAFRTGVGLRYFFTDNIGLNADIGLGGALFTFGITAKF